MSHMDVGFNFGTKAITLRPFDSFDYISQTENGFNETGAGAYNLYVKRFNAIFARNELGLQISTCLCSNTSKWTFAPKLSWVREVRIKGDDYSAKFLDTEAFFTVSGYFPDRSLFAPGVMISGSFWDDMLLFNLYYNGEYGNKYSDYNFGGQIRYGF